MANPIVEMHPMFISYSRDDDALFDVASAIRDQCRKKLLPMVRNRETLRHVEAGLLDVFFDKDGLPPNGDLGEELRRALEKSFSLCIVVGAGYARSEWCLRELEIFRQCLAGRPEALKQRLFVVVLDKKAEADVLGKPRWPTDLLSSTIRNDFCGIAPLAASRDGALPNPVFVEKVDRILKRLVDKIEEAYPVRNGGNGSGATPMSPVDGARVLIESSSQHPDEWRLVEEEIRRVWPASAGNMACTALTFEGQRTPARNALGESHGVILIYRGDDYDGLNERAWLVQRTLFNEKSNPARYVAWLTPEPPERCPDYVWSTVPFRDPVQALGEPRAASPEKLESLLADIQRVARESTPVARESTPVAATA